jgi:hypothetical protein
MAGSNNDQGGKNEKSGVPAIHWNDESMQTSYSNICNVAGTREEVSIFFGTNESWQAGKKPVEVRLDHRILITPYTAKRLHLLLENTLKQYESRYGVIELEAVESVQQHGSAGGGNGAAKS